MRRVHDRLYFIWHSYDDVYTDRISAFDHWNVRKFTILHEPIKGIRDYEVTHCYDQDPHNGKVQDVVEKTGKRHLDEIDYIGFLNQGENKTC